MLKRPGLRILKTGLAVILSMVISELRPGEGLAFYSAIAAIICMQQNVTKTYTKGMDRVLGTMFGGLLGLIYLVIIPQETIPSILDYLLISLVSVFIIWVLASFRRKDAVSIGAIVFMSITINHGNDPGGLPIPFAFNRTLDTLIGVLVAIFVNFVDFKLRKDHEKAHIDI